jgi:hypothetical protein
MSIVKRVSRGYQPKSQADIVAQKFPRPDAKVAVFKAESSPGVGKLPALGATFNSEEQFASFAVNTLRMRLSLEWQFTLCDPSAKLDWRVVVPQNQTGRYELQDYADKAADIIFTQDNCFGVRISTDGGIEAAFASETPPEDPTLVLVYRKI